MGIVHLAGRARPRDNKGANFFKFNNGSSFFSGHTTNAFEIATILSHHINFWPFTICSYAFATIISFQRLDSNAHWPSDVFLGAVYGITFSKALIKLHEKRKVKLLPAISAHAIGVQMIYEF